MKILIDTNILISAALSAGSIPYLTHNVQVQYPNAMLPVEAWDRAGMVLTFGFIPLLIANVLSFSFIKTKLKFIRFLFFIPSVVCFIIVVSYWTTSLV